MKSGSRCRKVIQNGKNVVDSEMRQNIYDNAYVKYELFIVELTSHDIREKSGKREEKRREVKRRRTINLIFEYNI